MPQVGVKFMSADKISHYMMSAMFLSRANAAVRKAVDRLKARGIRASAQGERQSVEHQAQTTQSCMTRFANEKGIPAVIIFAGPNGSGKSTITEAIVNIPGQFSGEYINADDIARLLQDPISDDHRRNIKAAQIAQE